MARTLTPATGSIFEELGFAAPEAAHLQVRATLMASLLRTLKRRKLTQVAAAELLGVSQPRISDLQRGKIDKFSLDALVELLSRAGLQVAVEVTPRRTSRPPRRSRAS